MKIYVVFDVQEAEAAIALAVAGDVILGDTRGALHEGLEHIVPAIGEDDTRQLASRTITLFEALKDEFGDNVEAFINVFFEATILPIAGYASTLAKVLRQRLHSGEDVVVVFPRRLRGGMRGSTFFLAEHEAHRRLLYRRLLVFQPYLEDVCRGFGVRVIYSGRPRISLLGVHLFVRRNAAMLVRYLVALGKTLARPRGRVSTSAGACDFIALSRSTNKSETLWPLLEPKEPAGHLVVAEAFVGINRNARFCKQLFRGTRVPVQHIVRPSIAEISRTYIQVLLRRVHSRTQWRFEAGWVQINVRPAVLELLSSYPDLHLYISALDATVRRMPHSRLQLFLSTELKSPYAYGDAAVARKHGCVCFHLMECDQYARALPVPVFGDLFIADSQQNLKQFHESWPEHRRQVVYWGPFKSWFAVGASVSLPPRRRYTWCFFTSSEPDRDLPVFEELVRIAQSTGASFIVKLHPRDSKRRYAMFPGVEMLSDGEMSKALLFGLFEYGLTFSSAIISELFGRGKPFLLLDAERQRFFNDSVHADKYPELTVRNLNDLHGAMSSIASKEGYFQKYRAELTNTSASENPSAFVAEMAAAARSVNSEPVSAFSASR